MTGSTEDIDRRLLSILACPRDHGALRFDGGRLHCDHGHSYPVVSGVPVFILAEKEQTIGIAAASLAAAESGEGGPIYADTLGISEEEKRGVERGAENDGIDSAVSHLVGATSGWGYVDMIGRTKRYPIPDIPVGAGQGELLLDIGCNWGRWSVSAAQKGWRVIGLDPSIGAVLASKRAFADRGLDIAYVCGDARFLPFKPGVFRTAFSYSVIQHFSEADADLALAEAGRVLQPGGQARIQMAHKGGLRSTYIRTRPSYMSDGPFRVRYWSLHALREAFGARIGPTRLIAEGFGGLGLLAEDMDYVSPKAKVLVAASTLLKRMARFIPPLIRLADSVYVVSSKP